MKKEGATHHICLDGVVTISKFRKGIAFVSCGAWVVKDRNILNWAVVLKRINQFLKRADIEEGEATTNGWLNFHSECLCS